MKILVVLLIAIFCGITTVILNLRFIEAWKKGIVDASSPWKTQWEQALHPGGSMDGASEEHTLAGLSCKDHGGPSNDSAVSEMVYWRDIPSDDQFRSPYADYGPKVKYLTVEPDEGFWNNKRMAMESAIALAVSTGRILVLPPKQDFIYEEIFHFHLVAKEGSALKVISMEEFLKREALTGNLKDKNGNVVYPPENNRTNWDGDMRRYWEGNVLWPYLRSVTKPVEWEPNKCIAIIPGAPGPKAAAHTREYAARVVNEGVDRGSRIMGYTNNPTPVNFPAWARLRENLGHRKNVCLYDEQMQEAKYLHTMGYSRSTQFRFFGHFYAIMFFEDWKQDLFVKRFVRDHFRYADDLQCAAARIVRKIRDLARLHSQKADGTITNPDGEFDTLHIRRGDFLNFYKESEMNGAAIYNNTHSVLEEGSVIYVATDERDKSFFAPLSRHYKLYFLDDFQNQLGGIPLFKYGMLDQLVAAKGRTFVGLFRSTFTGYINRMRAYFTQKNRVDGYLEGIIPSYFYAGIEYKYFFRQYQSISPPLWKTEFPVAWRDIDHDVVDPGPVEEED